jgi:hypothetical protein
VATTFSVSAELADLRIDLEILREQVAKLEAGFVDVGDCPHCYGEGWLPSPDGRPGDPVLCGEDCHYPQRGGEA